MKRRTLSLVGLCLFLILGVSLHAEAQANCTGVAAWAPNVSYPVHAKVTYSNRLYTCRQAHTSLVGWEPPNVASLWLDGGACGTATATATSGTATPTATRPTATPTATNTATSTPTGATAT